MDSLPHRAMSGEYWSSSSIAVGSLSVYYSLENASCMFG